MVYEVVTQHVSPENRDEHVKTWRKAWQEAAFEGAHDVKFLRCVEDPGKVVLLIEWDSVEAHQRHRGTPRHNDFRAASGVYSTAPAEVLHYMIEEL